MELNKNNPKTKHEKYDCIILNFWWSNNFGAILTAFAVQNLLKEFGYSSALVKYFPDSHNEEYPNNLSDKSAKKYLKTTEIYSNESDLVDLNNITNTFIVGSDQVFRPEYHRGFFYLNFADATKKKLAFSVSFGNSTFNGSSNFKKKCKFFLSRFDAISVREIDGVNICRDNFNLTATHIIDPVFILDKSKWEQLIKDSTLNENNYLLCYILDISEEIEAYINEQSENLGLKVIYIKKDTPIEDWLYLMKNSNFVITDSFHGVCFAMIFNKQFNCLGNNNRGASRFSSLIQKFNLPENNFSRQNCSNINNLNYTQINNIINLEAEFGKKWLKTNLEKDKKLSKREINNDKINIEKIYAITDLPSIISLHKIKHKMKIYKFMSKIFNKKFEKKYIKYKGYYLKRMEKNFSYEK